MRTEAQREAAAPPASGGGVDGLEISLRRGGGRRRGGMVWVFGGGLKDRQEASVVATDGTVSDGPYLEGRQYLGGFAVVDVPSREEALEWAARIAVACRCAQEVRQFVDDPTA